MMSFFWSWSRTSPVSVSKPKLSSRPVLVSVLVSEKFCGLGLGLEQVGLDYSSVAAMVLLLYCLCFLFCFNVSNLTLHLKTGVHNLRP